MKIGIATIYDSLNCGSFLQAYAMQHALEEMGHDVAVLDCHVWTCKRLIKKWISRSDFLFNFRTLMSYRKDLKKLHIEKNKGQKLDAVIIGSDEVWNLQGYFEHSPEYFGDHLNTDKIIAYAPSLGYYSVDDFVATETAQKIKKFRAVFPRDRITQEACEKILGEKCAIVCDPTILILDEWNKLKQPDTKRKEPYIVYYSYLDKTPMMEHIKRYAQESGYQIVIANFNYSWGNEIATPSPLQFLDLISNAECVFTSTFHGSVFSTLFRKQLVVRPSGQKVVDYLHKLGLDDRIYEDGCSYNEFIEQVNKPIAYESIFEQLSAMKAYSAELLRSSIET